MRRKKTLREECDALLNRHTAALATRKKRDLAIYVESLLERFAEMEFSLSELYSLIEPPATTGSPATTESPFPFQTHEQKRDHFANCFWAFSYSLFDILSHVINTIHPVAADESAVSFSRAARGYPDISAGIGGAATIPIPVAKLLKSTAKARYFKRLAAYRQCCLHRRAVCVFAESTTVSLSHPYASSTSRYDVVRTLTWICDDPNNINPTYEKKKSLQKECEEIRSCIEEDVRQLIRALR